MEEYMKKYLRYGLIVGLASVFALSAFAGCGGGENESSPSSSDSTSGNSSSVEDTENYEGYFKKMTITSGDLLVYGRAENLSTEQQFLAESIQGLFAQKGESKYYHYRTGSYETWLSEIETEYGKKNRDVTLSEMLQDYKENIGTGYVLFDKSVSASVNCCFLISFMYMHLLLQFKNRSVIYAFTYFWTASSIICCAQETTSMSDATRFGSGARTVPTSIPSRRRISFMTA